METKSAYIIRWSGLRKKFDDNISRSTIDRWIKEGSFPKKIMLGKNSVGWDCSEIDQWFHERANTAKGVI